jgi:serine/threonine protein kinase
MGAKESKGQAYDTTGMDASRGQCAALPPQLIRNATEHFTETNELGDGAFSTVYRGDLAFCKNIPADTAAEIARVGLPRRFAAKVTTLYEQQEGEIQDSFEKQLKDLKTELRILADCRHPNLCSLLGFSYDRTFRCLVYELCEGGDLSKRLHDDDDGAVPLSVAHRFRLAVDIASGLAYLHTQVKPPIIHR